MPNYNITIDSRFDPYSFEDYLKPLAILQEQHNQAADAYATALANSAGLYDVLADSAKVNAEDAEAAKYVNDYENSLNALASDLATNGLNRTNRRGVYETKAKTGYIEKLKKAIDNRNTFIAQQNELLAKDPTRRVSDYAYNHGITRFLNPDFTYGSYSLNDIKNQVAETVKYLAKSEYVPQGNNPTSKRIGYLTNLMQTKTGASMDDIRRTMQAIENNENLDSNQEKIASALKDVVIEAVDTNMGSNYEWDKVLRDEALQWGEQGLYSALGNIDYKIWNEQEPKLPSGSGKDNEDLGSEWWWRDVISAKNDMDLHGIDTRQTNIAHSVNNYLKDNKSNDKPDYSSEARLNYTKNLSDYLKDARGDKNGVISDKDKLIACKLLIESGMNYSSKEFRELLPKKYLDAYNASYRGNGGNANSSDEADNAIAQQKAYNYVCDLISRDKSVTDGEYKNLAEKYDDYVSKGAVYSEAAFFRGLSPNDLEGVFQNILQMGGLDPNEDGELLAGYYKGQNAQGDFVNSLTETKDYKNMKESLYDKNGKWNSENQIGLATDSNGNLVAIIRGNGKAYQLDLTKGLSSNNEAVYKKVLEYSAIQRHYTTLKQNARNDRIIQNFYSNPESLTSDELIYVKEKLAQLNDAYNTAQTAGKKTYDALYKNTTLSQKRTTRSDNETAYKS